MDDRQGYYFDDLKEGMSQVFSKSFPRPSPKPIS